ncbi:MAG: hypothetical protein QOD07_712 [Frankiaceae bacterium]|jgi:hypothetical protein|nr:hypothetical protein [Frankiaceae bacterium]
MTTRVRRSAAAAVVLTVSIATGVLASPQPPHESTSYVTRALPPAAPVATDFNGRNDDYEPAVAVGGDGTRWVVANIMQTAAVDTTTTPPSSRKGPDSRELELLSGADVWRSTDNGRTFRWLTSLFTTNGTAPGTGGEDSDIAVAPQRNPSTSRYNVYVVSNWVASASVAISTDGGSTWQTMALGGVEPLTDRPYVTADGPCTFYITYHALQAASVAVNRYDACGGASAPATPVPGQPLDPAAGVDATLDAAALVNRIGKPVVDPVSHALYVPMLQCDSTSVTAHEGDATSSSGCGGRGEVVVAVSRDGASTFALKHVAYVADGRVPTWGVSAAVGRHGRLFVSWSDDVHAYVAMSPDGASTWSVPARMDLAQTRAVYPTLAVGPAGDLAAAWYQADATSWPHGDVDANAAPSDATWRFVIATSSDGVHWRPDVLPAVVHAGPVCTYGTACSSDTRALYDNLGLAMGSDGTVTAAYMDDQPGGTIAADHVVYSTSYRVRSAR